MKTFWGVRFDCGERLLSGELCKEVEDVGREYKGSPNPEYIVHRNRGAFARNAMLQ